MEDHDNASNPVTAAVMGAIRISSGWCRDTAAAITRRAKDAGIRGLGPDVLTRFADGDRSMSLEHLRAICHGNKDRSQAAIRTLAAELDLDVAFVGAGHVGDVMSEAMDVGDAAQTFVSEVMRDMRDGRLDKVEEHRARANALAVQLAEANAALDAASRRAGR